MSRLNIVGILLTASALAGCAIGCSGQPSSSSPQPVSDFGTGGVGTVISGRATTDGKPLVVGAVVFMGENGVVGEAPVYPDGRYECGLVPEGPVKVVFSSVRLRPADRRSLQGLPPDLPPGHADSLSEPSNGVPNLDTDNLTVDGRPVVSQELAQAKAAEARYGNARKTTIRYTVVKGPQTFDVDFSIAK